MKRFLLIIILAVATTANSQSTIVIGTTTLGIDTVYSGLDVPWEMIMAPDSQLWITERKGLVSRIDPVNKTKTVLLDIHTSVYAVAEAGMLGMALHPDFPATNEVYLVYTYGAIPNVKERLVRYLYVNDSLINPVIMLDSIAAGTSHNGSRLFFMPDKTLLMSTGDSHIATAPQSTSAINGKVLRLNADGSVPADNPFPGSYTYSFGHRNVQGITLAPGGEIYISEHGTANDDEFQHLEKGRNYGWPDVEGFCDQPGELAFCAANNVKEPIVDWTPSIAPNDLIYYENNRFPEFDKRFIMTTLKNKQLVAIQLNPQGTASVSLATYLTGEFGRLRDICVGTHHEIYIATNGAEAANLDPGTHSILVLTPPTPTTNIAEKKFTSLSVYPTITSDRITIEPGDEPTTGIALIIIDVTGNTRMRTAFRTSLSLSPLANGLYFLRVERNGLLLDTFKIIVRE
jgi:glucose/arabinose dehydrogenase